MRFKLIRRLLYQIACCIKSELMNIFKFWGKNTWNGVLINQVKQADQQSFSFCFKDILVKSAEFLFCLEIEISQGPVPGFKLFRLYFSLSAKISIIKSFGNRIHDIPISSLAIVCLISVAMSDVWEVEKSYSRRTWSRVFIPSLSWIVIEDTKIAKLEVQVLAVHWEKPGEEHCFYLLFILHAITQKKYPFLRCMCMQITIEKELFLAMQVQKQFSGSINCWLILKWWVFVESV